MSDHNKVSRIHTHKNSLHLCKTFQQNEQKFNQKQKSKTKQLTHLNM